MKLTPLLLLPMLLASGCAAMVRTWHFKAEAVESKVLRVAVAKAEVKQKVAHVTLRLTNRGQQAGRVEVGTLTLTLPDGTAVPGKTSLLGRAGRGVQNALATVGLGRRAEQPELRPGDSLELKVAFRSARRDLRRFGELRVDLAGIRFNNAALDAQPLVLRAPPGAPRGEHI